MLPPPRRHGPPNQRGRRVGALWMRRACAASLSCLLASLRRPRDFYSRAVGLGRTCWLMSSYRRVCLPAEARPQPGGRPPREQYESDQAIPVLASATEKRKEKKKRGGGGGKKQYIEAEREARHERGHERVERRHAHSSEDTRVTISTLQLIPQYKVSPITSAHLSSHNSNVLNNRRGSVVYRPLLDHLLTTSS